MRWPTACLRGETADYIPHTTYTICIIHAGYNSCLLIFLKKQTDLHVGHVTWQ